MSYGVVRNWPPIWTATDGTTFRPRTEIGTLIDVRMNDSFRLRLYLTIKYQRETYVASISFDESQFYKHIFSLLQTHIGCSIQEIGDLDVN